MTSEEALQAFMDAKANPKTHPATIQRLWEAYTDAVIAEMKHPPQQPKEPDDAPAGR